MNPKFPAEMDLPHAFSPPISELVRQVPPAGRDPKEIIKALDDFEANAVPLGPETLIAMDEAAVVQFSKVCHANQGKVETGS